MRKFLVMAVMFFMGSLTQALAENNVLFSIEFKHVDNPEIVAFAVDKLRGEEIKLSEEEWVAAVKEHALYAEIDIDDDGVPERFLQYSYFCPKDGCSTWIYKRIGRLRNTSASKRAAVGFMSICYVDITGNDPQTYLLKKKENGFHQIDTKNGETIHWLAKNDRLKNHWCF
jgi:hypothetical protein